MDRESAGSQTGRNTSDEVERYLTKIYYDTKNPASYSGIEKLYNYVKDQGKKKFLKIKLEYGSVNKILTQLIDLLEELLGGHTCLKIINGTVTLQICHLTKSKMITTVILPCSLIFLQDIYLPIL